MRAEAKTTAERELQAQIKKQGRTLLPHVTFQMCIQVMKTVNVIHDQPKLC